MCDDGIGFNSDIEHSGLGLKIIHDIARTLNMEASLQSSKGGTTFRFSQP